MEKFTLSEKFINKYKRKKPPFGFNGLGELVYMRTYSRIKDDGKMKDGGKQEAKSCRRYLHHAKKNWIDSHQLGDGIHEKQKSNQDMYERIFTMKFLPPESWFVAYGYTSYRRKGLYAAFE